MPLSTKTKEIKRLLKAFEAEAAKFPEIRLSVYYMTEAGASIDRPFTQPNHNIPLWQYYGVVGTEEEHTRLFASIQGRDPIWGMPGAKFSSFALIEGSACELFVRMARRAGSLFNRDEAWLIGGRVLDEILRGDVKAGSTARPVGSLNSNPLALWLNFLLYHLSLTHPDRERSQKIEPDPFTLSMLALERLAEEHTIGKVDRSDRPLSDIKFKVAMTFPGERRAYVAKVVRALRRVLGPDSVFYDFDYQAQLARPNLDTLLQDIYLNRSELIVVFLCAEYSKKEWCGLEWRAVREIIKSKADERIMFVRFDHAAVEGVFSIDGYIDAERHKAGEVAKFIVDRVELLPKAETRTTDG